MVCVPYSVIMKFNDIRGLSRHAGLEIPHLLDGVQVGMRPGPGGVARLLSIYPMLTRLADLVPA